MPATLIAPQGAQELLHRIDIPAKEPWCSTPVMLIAGERYFFRASGTWVDWKQTHDANGAAVAHLKPFLPFLRCRAQDATWFTLIGSIEKNPQSFFAIGDGLRWPIGWVAPASGQLRCFANDVRPMYFNNRGAISLQVWR